MAYNQNLAQRVRDELQDAPGFQEKKMFGGVGFLVQGNMACGVHGEDLIIRVGKDNYVKALDQSHTRPFDMTGKPMSGWIVVVPQGVQTKSDLREWVKQGVEFARSLPAK